MACPTTTSGGRCRTTASHPVSKSRGPSSCIFPSTCPCLRMPRRRVPRCGVVTASVALVCVALLTLTLLALTTRLNHQGSPQPRIALVVPFVWCQVDSRLARSLAAWTTHLPCSTPAALHASLSLVFLYNQDLEAVDSLGGASGVPQLSALWASLGPAVQACFRGGVHYLSARVPPQLNSYPLGTCVQFYSTFGLLRSMGFDHWQQLEPDVVPLRANWAHRIAELAAANQPGCSLFWQAGSYPTYVKQGGGVQEESGGGGGVDLHLNGNSLYCLADTRLDGYLSRVQQASPHGCGSRDTGWGFDWAMYLFRTRARLSLGPPQPGDGDRDRARALYLRFVRHKFIATDLLANFGTEPVEIKDLPQSTMLLHASADFQDKWDTLSCRRGEAGQPPAPADAGIAVHARMSHGLGEPPGACPLVALEETFGVRSSVDGGYTAYELTGSAARPDGGGPGVVLTTSLPSQGGHVEFVSALEPSKLCGGTVAGCALTFVMSWSAAADNGTTLGDGLALSLADAALEVPLSVKYTAVSGVVVPRNALSLVIDEFDNGDGMGVWLVASRSDGSTSVLARFSNASAVNATAAPGEARLQLSGGLASAEVNGLVAFQGVRVALPTSLLLVLSANTGSSRGVHTVRRVHACVTRGGGGA